MIESIAHKGLKKLWEKDDLDALDSINTLEPLRAIPGYKLHSLSGDLKGFWSVTVTGNYRIVFRFENENVSDVDYTDYH